MKKIIILSILILSCWSFVRAQYVPDIEDLLIDDIYPAQEFENINDVLRLGTSYNFYNDFKNWIPYCNSEPLKNPPITYVEVSFHVFLDSNGQNSNYTNTPEGKNKLLYILNSVNQIYSGGWVPSDTVSGVVDLPNHDTRIRFTLGDNNERIYFYNNTAQNHNWDHSSFYNYVQTNFPSRVSKLNIFFTSGYYQGRVKQSDIVITNGGSGYTSTPSITFNPSGASATAVIENGVLTGINIITGGSYYGFSPPQITISGGGGSGATAIVTKLSEGATGISNPPLTDLSTNHHVVMYHCHESNDWIFGMTVAHELAHNLGLQHTYCGGNASVVCCSGSCSKGCTKNCSNKEYLSDIFGDCQGTTCPHKANWGNPYDDTIQDAVKITNNVMGGSDSQVYFSPMQAGQMHRTLALKSTRKYVKTDTYSTIPLVIDSNETWDFNLKLYRDVNISSGAILTISNIFELPYNGTLIINNDAALVISGTLKLSDSNKIIVKNGGTIKFSSTSNIQINGSGKIEVQSGGYFCIESGATITLSNFNSVINLRNGYISGVNTVVLPSSNCISNPISYTITGNGKINQYNQNVYIQNETISTDRYYTGRYIYVGNNVTSSIPQGDVFINNNSKVIFDAEQDVVFDKGFEVSSGSSIEVIQK